MTLQKCFIRGFTLFIVALFAAATLVFVWQVERVKAIRISELNFGTVSLSPGQTIRFNVVNPSKSSRQHRLKLAFDIYSLGGPDTLSGSTDGVNEVIAACTNNLRFVRREFCEATLRPGEAVTLDFTFPAGEARINPVIIQDLENSDFDLVTTLEIREGGRTLFVHPSVTRGFNPQVDFDVKRISTQVIRAVHNNTTGEYGFTDLPLTKTIFCLSCLDKKVGGYVPETQSGYVPEARP